MRAPNAEGRRPRQLAAEQLSTRVDLSRIVVDELELRLGHRTRAMFQKVCDVSPNLVYLYERAKKERTYLGRHLLEVLGYGGPQQRPSAWFSSFTPRIARSTRPSDSTETACFSAALGARIDSVRHLERQGAGLVFTWKTATDRGCRRASDSQQDRGADHPAATTSRIEPAAGADCRRLSERLQNRCNRRTRRS